MAVFWACDNLARGHRWVEVEKMRGCFLKHTASLKTVSITFIISLCESLRVSRKRVLQRRVLHLGELNTTQLESWQRSIEVVEEDGRRHTRCGSSAIGTGS